MGSNTDLRQVTETWEPQMRVTPTLGGGGWGFSDRDQAERTWDPGVPPDLRAVVGLEFTI
jgi:hypothetical protein